MAKRIFLLLIAATLLPIGFWPIEPVFANLPPGNRVKDPYTILRNSLPIEQKELREIQNQIEDTTDALRGSRWPTIVKAISKSKFLINNKKTKIIESIPINKKEEGEKIISSIKIKIEKLAESANQKDKNEFLNLRRASLSEIGNLERLIVKDEFPYTIPSKYDSLPRLLGRATVEISTSKGDMTAIIDGFNAPLTAGAFIDLAEKGFYDKLPINRAEEFFVLQTGDPKGDQIGYVDPETNEERHVPLEIRVPDRSDTIYESSFEELGLYTETPTMPFATVGTLGWAHSDKDLNDGSSQFFFFLYEAELNPAGRNLIDGRYAAFGYVVEGEEILSTLEINDQINYIKVIDGSDRLKKRA